MGAVRIYTAPTPFNSVELPEIHYEQTADVLYLAHLDHAPSKFTRYAHTDWRWAQITFGPTIEAPTGFGGIKVTAGSQTGYVSTNYPYVVTAIDDETGQESVASLTAIIENDLTVGENKNVLSWSASTGADRYVVYRAQNGIYGYIGGTEALTFTDQNIIPDLSDTPPVLKNPFSATGDYPSSVTFYEQRLVWGRTRNVPNGIYMSQSANFENMNVSRPAKANDAVTFGLVARRVNAVNSLVPQTDLLAMTSDGPFAVTGGGNTDYITPSSIVNKRQGSRGVSRLRPIEIDDVTFFTPIKGNGVRTLGYTFETDGYRGGEISIFSPHFFAGRSVVDWAYTQDPLSVIWLVMDDGQMLALTWEQEQQVWGWTRIEVDGFVESVCSISEGVEDRLYLIVKRSVGDEDQRYIERMASYLWEEQNDANFLDCSLSYSSEDDISSVSNLEHLAGRTVCALIDGSVARDLTVGSDGSLTLPFAGKRIHIGLPFTAEIKTLPLVATVQGLGSTKGRNVQVGETCVSVIDSRGIKGGPNEANMFELKQRQNEAYGAPIDLFTGNMTVGVSPDWNGEGQLILRSEDPLPMYITGVFPDSVVGG